MIVGISGGNQCGYFCPHCGSRCLCDINGDWFPSEYCPHCGKKVNPAGRLTDKVSPMPRLYELISSAPNDIWNSLS